MDREIIFCNIKDLMFFMEILNKGKVNFKITQSDDEYNIIRFKCCDTTFRKYAKIIMQNNISRFKVNANCVHSFFPIRENATCKHLFITIPGRYEYAEDTVVENT